MPTSSASSPISIDEQSSPPSKTDPSTGARYPIPSHLLEDTVPASSSLLPHWHHQFFSFPIIRTYYNFSHVPWKRIFFFFLNSLLSAFLLSSQFWLPLTASLQNVGYMSCLAFLFWSLKPTPCRLPPLLNFTNCAPLTDTSDICVTEASGWLFGVHL